jgi:hypothetical protein
MTYAATPACPTVFQKFHPARLSGVLISFRFSIPMPVPIILFRKVELVEQQPSGV